MKKVNLSRLNNMIRDEIADLSERKVRLCLFDPSLSTTIFEKSENSAIIKFKAELSTKAQAYRKLDEECYTREEYIGYLKAQLDRANHKYGVTTMLAEANVVRNRIARLTEMRSHLTSFDHLENTASVKDVDYYKSAFTENERTYTLKATAFDVNEEYDALSRRIEEEKTALREIMDRIASVNQTKFVQVRELDEKAE